MISICLPPSFLYMAAGNDKLLEFLGIAAGLGVIYLVAENNAPLIRRAVSNIHSTVSNAIVPVSTGVPRDERLPASRGTCPKGYYPDYTDGILHCHDAHGTRELNPNVMTSPWRNAWGLDEDGYAVPLIPTPSQTLTAPAPVPQTLIGPITSEEYPSKIKKSVNPQIEKQDKKKKHKAQIPDEGVHTQVECPNDLNIMKCGSNCYKDGKLWKIVCSEKEREALYPKTKKKQPSVTIPPNFPDTVTISPGEESYPEQAGDEPSQPDIPIPPLQLAPGQDQQPIQPTIPPTTPGRGPTQTVPPQIVTTPIQGGGTIFYPYKPRSDGGKELPNGCEPVKVSKGHTNSCRWEAPTDVMKSHGLATTSYRIDGLLDLGDQADSNNQELSITTGGPGSTDANCCGFTGRINIKDGTLQMESEDWTNHDSGGGTTGNTLCRGANCTDGPLKSISGNKPLYNTKNIGISLIVQNDGNNASYTMVVTGPAGTITSKTFKNPPAHKGSTGPAIIPYKFIHQGKVTNDGDRIRVDSCKTMNFHGGPKVTILPRGFYQGDLGYIDPNESFYGFNT